MDLPEELKRICVEIAKKYSPHGLVSLSMLEAVMEGVKVGMEYEQEFLES